MGLCISGCIRFLQWGHDRHVAYKEYVADDQPDAALHLTPAEREPSVLLVFSILERQTSEEKAISFLKRVFSKNPNLIMQRNASGETLLYFICKEGKLGVITFLLKMGSPAHDICSKGTAIHGCIYAIHNNKMSVQDGCNTIELLLQYGCNIEGKDDKMRTAFYLATSLNSIPVMEVLEKQGCDVTARSCDKMTSLHVAVEEGHPLAVDFILGVCRPSLIGMETEHKRSALHLALEGLLLHFLPPHLVVTSFAWLDPTVAIIERLLKAGANPNMTDWDLSRYTRPLTSRINKDAVDHPLLLGLCLLKAIQESQVRDGLLSLEDGHSVLDFAPVIQDGLPMIVSLKSTKYTHMYRLVHIESS